MEDAEASSQSANGLRLTLLRNGVVGSAVPEVFTTAIPVVGASIIGE
jgi:hypothetical protein